MSQTQRRYLLGGLVLAVLLIFLVEVVFLRSPWQPVLGGVMGLVVLVWGQRLFSTKRDH